MLVVLLCAYTMSAQAPGCPQIDAGPDQNLTCANNCVTLTATAFETGLTTDYAVGYITYAPPFGFTGGTSIFVNADDEWSSAISLPFSFCFYGNTYNQLVVGANGVISFDVTLANDYCEFDFNAPIPTPGPPPSGIYNNSINGAYHDIDPASLWGNGNINYRVLGTSPCRTFVVNFSDVDHYFCETGLFGGGKQTTQQIVLYETTNAIEVYIRDKPVCSNWNNGNAVIGIQNATGTQGVSPPGRNTGARTASNEAWRFTPSGVSNTTVNWYDGNMNLITTGNAVQVCPTSATTYTAEAVYDRCDGSQITEQDQVVVTVVGGFNTTSSSTDETCTGCDGTITVSATGGTPPFSFDLGNGPQATGSFTGLCSGSYTVTISDNGGCSGTETFTIAPGSSYTVSEAVLDETCLGSADGAVTFTTTGGTGPFTYNIGVGPSNSTGFFSGLGASSYSYTVTDANGCVVNGSFTVAAGPNCCGMTLTSAFTDETCGGLCDGTISVTANSATPPVSFDMGGGAQANGIFTGLCTGNYTVTVTDGTGCVDSALFTIGGPAPLAISETITNASCGGLPDGAVDVTVSGGTPSYTYQWSNTAVTEDISNVASGVYDLTLSDVNGCSLTTSYTVGQPVNIVISETITDLTCNSDQTGAIDISVSGGTGPYTYLWSNTLWGFTATTQDISGLLAGVYDVTVVDANSCNGFGSYTVSQPTPLAISALITDPTCSGTSVGAIDVTVTGSVPPYTYLWSTTDVTEDLNNISAGSYDLTVTDANGCTLNAAYNLTPPTVITVSEVITDATCAGGADGAIDLTVNGGIQPYSFLWSTTDVTEDVSGLAAGTYTVTITDMNGCTVTPTYTVGAPPPIVINNTVTDVSCSGAGDGAIDITVLGGTSPYSFSWSNTVFTEDNPNLIAGTYDVTVYDAFQCSATASYTIAEPDPLAITSIATDVQCNGAADGSIDVTVSGGTVPYTYLWSTTDVTEDLNNLDVGQYDVTVTDGNQCTTTATYIITEPTLLTVTATVIDASCGGLADGSIDATVNGGTAPYSYLWSNAAVSIDLTNIVAGTYDFTVTDGNQCTATGSYIVNEPTPIVVTGQVVDASCFDTDDGSVDVTTTAGVAPLSFLWSSTDVTEDITAKLAGTYVLTVTDGNNCSVSSTFNIGSPDSIAFSGVVTDASCNGLTDGSIDITPSGGAAPYTYNWSNTEVTQDVSSIAAGNYTLTITDANSCVDSISLTVKEPDPLNIDTAEIAIACVGVDDGAIFPTVTGGSGVLRYTWSNGSSQYELNGLAGGIYGLTVTDENGCAAVDSFVVPADSLNIVIDATPDTLLDLGEELTLTAIGDGAIDQIVWAPEFYLDDPTATTVNATLDVGVYEYNAFATNPNGCRGEATVTIWVENEVFLYVPNAFSPNGDGFNDVFIYEASGEVELVRMLIFNRWGEKIYEGVNSDAGWDGTENGQLVDEGVYIYVMDIKYKELSEVGQTEGHIRKFKGSITVIR